LEHGISAYPAAAVAITLGPPLDFSLRHKTDNIAFGRTCMLYIHNAVC
jgi:hypothetical protein